MKIPKLNNSLILVFLLVVILIQSCKGNNTSDTSEKRMSLEKNQIVFQGVDLFGDSLYSEVDSVSQKNQLSKLKEAMENYSKHPGLENLIWVGRREAYLGRYDLSIKTFTKAISDFPEAYEPYRHRGHRYISIREFERATKDFHKASVLMEGKPVQVEQDGIPNKVDIPLSNVQFNVWYHLGLAYYLQGNFEAALKAYESCMKVSDNDDLKVATLDWYYMTLMKLGRSKDAAEIIAQVNTNMTVIENDAYFKRNLMYKGELDPELLLETDTNENDRRLQYVTQGYGLGNYFLNKGDTAKAKSIFENVIKSGYWAAFGYIASEFELSKLENE